MIVLGALIWGACAITGSFIYSEWLFHRAYYGPVKWYDYWPNWVLVLFALSTVGLSLWYFGKYNVAAFMISDIVFMGTIGAVVFGLLFWAIRTGGHLQTGRGKVLFALFGFWHGILQVLVPFLLVKRGSWLSFVLVALSVVIFRWIGMRLINLHSRWLAILWFVYGLWLLYLPFLRDPKHSVFATRSLLLILLALVAASLGGLVMACVSFGWYLAVSLAFNGHNNEAGGAARIEGFKAFMRIRLTPENLTAYVIGFKSPEIDGENLDLRIIDMFQLRPVK
jgi:hypothetical protein